MGRINKTTLTTACLLSLVTFLTVIQTAIADGRLDDGRAFLAACLGALVAAGIAGTSHILTTRKDNPTR